MISAYFLFTDSSDLKLLDILWHLSSAEMIDTKSIDYGVPKTCVMSYIYIFLS